MSRSKLIFGIGINDADYRVKIFKLIDGKRFSWECPFYKKWANMMQRCYYEPYKLRYPSYEGCQTVPEWHYFMTFRDWMENQDWEGKHLDKDILFPGNKMYGPDTCVFVDPRVNTFLTDNAVSRGEWPIGVCFDKMSGKFKASCWSVETGKCKHIGLYRTAQEGHEAWFAFKAEQAKILASQQTDARVAKALIDRYSKGDENEVDTH